MDTTTLAYVAVILTMFALGLILMGVSAYFESKRHNEN